MYCDDDAKSPVVFYGKDGEKLCWHHARNRNYEHQLVFGLCPKDDDYESYKQKSCADCNPRAGQR